MVYREILNMGHANVYVSMATGQNPHTFYLSKTHPIFFLPSDTGKSTKTILIILSIKRFFFMISDGEWKHQECKYDFSMDINIRSKTGCHVKSCTNIRSSMFDTGRGI
jgi:hypothetical protein